MDTFPDIYFLPEWGQAYEAKETGGELRRFELENEIGHVSYQFIIRKTPVQTEEQVHYDTITPFGFSGPVILKCLPDRRKELSKIFDEAFQEYCMKNNIVTEYVRFNGWINNLQDFEDFYKTRNHGTTIFVDLTGEDFFRDEFSSNTRKQVRKSKKNNVEVELDYTGSSSHEFARLYEKMVKKNDVTNEYYQFSKEFIRDSFHYLSGKQFLINAKYEGKYISSVLIIHHGDFLHYHLAANDPDYFHLAGSSSLIYEACCWGVENGKKAFHLGGASNDENLHRFKMGFTKSEPLELLIGMKIRDHESYRELVTVRKKMAEPLYEGYFPLYRG